MAQEEIINMSEDLKIRVWKRFKLEAAKEALQALFSKERWQNSIRHQ